MRLRLLLLLVVCCALAQGCASDRPFTGIHCSSELEPTKPKKTNKSVVVYEYGSSTPISDAAVLVETKASRQRIAFGTTDSNGVFRFIQKKRLLTRILVVKAGYRPVVASPKALTNPIVIHLKPLEFNRAKFF